MDQIPAAFKKLELFVEKEAYKGWDLFDGLNSELFRDSFLYRSEWLRLFWIQLFKRSPINFRQIAKVPKGFNPKGLGLFASGLLYQGRSDEAEKILTRLEDLKCTGYNGVSWGYNFDWQARAFYVPAGKPNIVTTVFVARAFFDLFDFTGSSAALEMGMEACRFIENHLIQFEDEKHLCFAYIPGEEARVHNASMLGAALLARGHRYRPNTSWLEKSRKAMAYSVAALNPDYSWPYGELHHHRFIDNFHTGFNLVALKNWMDASGERTWEEELAHAYEYYLKTFWLENGCPRYYHDSLYPIDIHCSAQGIITCLKLARYHDQSLELAHRISLWAIENMQDEKGFFYYQKNRFFTNRIPYIRWAQAWMFYALSMLIHYTNHHR